MALKSKKGLFHLLYLMLISKDSDKIYDYFHDVWPELFALMPGKMDFFFLNFGLWLPNDTVAPMQRMHMYIQEKTNIQPSDRILDIGSGYGGQNILCYNNHKPQEIVGLEINKQLCDYCVQNTKELGLSDKIRYIQGDAVKLPADIANNYFDKVFALHCIYHFSSRVAFFKEAHRCLKPNGSLIIVDNYLKRMPQDAIERKMVNFDKNFMKTPDPYYTEARLFEELRVSGFKVTSSESIIQNIFPPFFRFMCEKRKEIEAFRRKQGYPKFFINTCYKAMEWLKITTEQGLYESAIVQANKE